MARVPVIYNDADTLLHRRDPRTKVGLFFALIGLLYLTPDWRWMAALAAVGLVMAITAKVPRLWFIVLLALQVPNIIGLIVVPVAEDLAVGRLVFDQDFAFGLKLAFAWVAAIFISISLFTTMQVDEMTDGMRGLGFPEVVCFTVGYAFLLLYLSLSDLFKINDAMKVKGVDLETKNPIRLARALPRLMIPAIFTIVRRSATMMAVLQMRGFSMKGGGRSPATLKFDAGDAALALTGLLVFAAVANARFDLVAL